MVERILHLDLNDCSDVAFLTKSGSLFHTRGGYSDVVWTGVRG